MSSPRFRGDIAQTRVRRVLAAGLEKNRYTIFNDLLVPSGGGTTAIDHVVVSRFGIFVIASCYQRGRISGTEVQDQWRRQGWLGTSRFDNPMHRNRLQVEALQRLLDFPARVFIPAVVMVGQRGFKTKPPGQVVTPERLLDFIRKRSRQELSPEQADRALQKIGAGRLTLVRWMLAMVLLAGLWLAFGDDFGRLVDRMGQAQERRAAPEQFHPDGTRKTEREIWEDSLRCAYSPDTGRCSCYEPDGNRADLSAEACRSLARRGSILER